MTKNTCKYEFNSADFGDDDKRIWRLMEAFRHPSWEVYERFGYLRVCPCGTAKDETLLPTKEMREVSDYFQLEKDSVVNLTDDNIEQLAQDWAQETFGKVVEGLNADGVEEYKQGFEEEFGVSLWDEMKLLAQSVLEYSRGCARRNVESSVPDYVCHYMFDKFPSSFNIIKDEDELIRRREAFIEENVEGPCQGITRRLMEAGKITYCSNAYAKGDDYPKGVLWMEPEYYFKQLLDDSNKWLDERYITSPPQEFLTDLEGNSWVIDEDIKTMVIVYDFHGNVVGFSDVVPDEQDFDNAPEREQPGVYTCRTVGECVWPDSQEYDG